MSTPLKPERACRRCKVVKRNAEFFAGREAIFSYVCASCTEAEAWAMKDTYVSLAKRRTTREVDGVLMRVCSLCRVDKPLLTEFYVNARDENGEPTIYNYECRPCAIAKTTRIARKQREGPERARILARKRRQAAIRRATPEGKRTHAAAQKRYAARVKADPAKRAARAEAQRMNYRLRRERKTGKPVERSFSKVLRVGRTPSYLPSRPLARLIERVIDERAERGRVLDDPSGTGPEAVCQDLGVTSRNFRRWRNGEQPRVRVGTAEAVLLAADVEWHEVYSYDDHAHVFLAESVAA